MEPPEEVAGRLLDDRPEAVAGEALVIGQERGQDIVFDLCARRAATAGDVAHHIRIAVEVDQIVDVVSGEPTQDQALCLQEYVHS
jgi:hypothetical protein